MQKRISSAALIASAVLFFSLAGSAFATTPTVSNVTLTCSQLSFSYSGFSSSGFGSHPQQEFTLLWSIAGAEYAVTRVDTAPLTDSGTITVAVPGFSPRQGTLSVWGVWYFNGGGVFTAQTNCGPAAPAARREAGAGLTRALDRPCCKADQQGARRRNPRVDRVRRKLARALNCRVQGRRHQA